MMSHILHLRLHMGIKKAILDSAEELSQAGFTESQSMAEKILRNVK